MGIPLAAACVTGAHLNGTTGHGAALVTSSVPESPSAAEPIRGFECRIAVVQLPCATVCMSHPFCPFTSVELTVTSLCQSGRSRLVSQPA